MQGHLIFDIPASDLAIVAILYTIASGNGK
jgi:hypothetical protein